MSDALDRIAPEAGPKGEALYRHELVDFVIDIQDGVILTPDTLSDEGPDDMPVSV